ncbi:hypothetical protein [Streptosporangium sp. NPDC023615]|uniref:hypothetical protein n=1 Tax=Streptosporangium sp. NPDC023615 TaxID=3154794 RepID=UPI00344429D1
MNFPPVEVRYGRWDAPLSGSARELRDLFGVDTAYKGVTVASVELRLDGITLITGFSGTGKSSLLRELRRTGRVRTIEDLPEIGPRDRVIDLFDGEVRRNVSWLGRFGLGEPRLMMSKPEHLSEGQFHRLTLARLARLARLEGAVIAVDEFCSTLDRTTARVIAHGFQKACRTTGVDAVVATAHDDLAEFVCPDDHVHLDFDGGVVRLPPPGPGLARWIAEEFTEGRGDRADYDRLASYHYRSDDERWIDWDNLVTEVRTVKAGDRIAAVKVFCRPFPQGFEILPTLKAINARLLSQERVIVHPAFRGLSLNSLMWPSEGGAKTLVAQSALGAFFPFNLRVGYRRVDHPSESPAPAQLAMVSALQKFDPDVNLNSVEAVRRLLVELDDRQVERIRALVATALEDCTCRQIEFLAELADVEPLPSDLESVREIVGRAVRAADRDGLALFVETAAPFRMAGFVRP